MEVPFFFFLFPSSILRIRIKGPKGSLLSKEGTSSWPAAPKLTFGLNDYSLYLFRIRHFMKRSLP